MDCSLKLITPPEVEPVTVAEVKLHTHISHSVEDALLETWIIAGRMLAEDFQRRAYIGQMWEVAFDSYPQTPIYLPRAPLIGVVSIKIYDYLNAETVLYSKADNPITTTEEAGTDLSTNSDFIIDTDSEPGRIGFAYNKTWPSTILRSMSAVKIRFAAGYGLEASDVPATVKDAIMLYCAYRNENRAAEVDEAPKQFFNLLRHDRLYV
jgi:hypothetical protein